MQPESDVPQELVDEPSNEELRAISRRSALRLLGGAGLFIVAACATETVATATSGASGTTAAPGTTAGATASTLSEQQEAAFSSRRRPKGPTPSISPAMNRCSGPRSPKGIRGCRSA